jgi:threonine/homoserine/homoserine lactone efflux protein
VSSALLTGAFWIKLIGSVVLLVLGARIALIAPQPEKRTQSTGFQGHAFIMAYGLTMTNTPTILFFAGIFASVASITSASQAVTFAAGVFAGSMLWWLILTTVVSKSAAVFQPPVLLWINRLSGSVLVVFAIYGIATLA